jgi:hypothetical protein
MKTFAIFVLICVVVVLNACDVQSGIASKSVEKYTTTPTPQPSVAPEEPIDPADVVTVDATQEGPKLTVKKITDNTALSCDKYNRVAINIDDKSFKITGICKELMINGDRNQVTMSAASEIVVNGAANNVKYSKYANGKRPFVKDNGGTSSVEKVAEATVSTKKR